jgi:hypothetical protein
MSFSEPTFHCALVAPVVVVEAPDSLALECVQKLTADLFDCEPQHRSRAFEFRFVLDKRVLSKGGSEEEIIIFLRPRQRQPKLNVQPVSWHKA